MSLRLPTALLVVNLAAGFSIELPATESERQSSNLPACDPNDGGLVLPEGFCAVIVADNLGSPRLIDVSANGDIYVHDQGTAAMARTCLATASSRFATWTATGVLTSSSSSPITTGRVSSCVATICIFRRPPRCTAMR